MVATLCAYRQTWQKLLTRSVLTQEDLLRHKYAPLRIFFPNMDIAQDDGSLLFQSPLLNNVVEGVF